MDLSKTLVEQVLKMSCHLAMLDHYLIFCCDIRKCSFQAISSKQAGSMDFRAILKAGEISDRAYALTEEVIKNSQGNYTAWFYRRKCLDELKLPLEDEMRWLQLNGLSMEKNY